MFSHGPVFALASYASAGTSSRKASDFVKTTPGQVAAAGPTQTTTDNFCSTPYYLWVTFSSSRR